MPRPLVLGNGNLLVAYDAELSIRDFTYPYVGLLHHLSGHYIRIGVWIGGRFAWLSDPGWDRSLAYQEDTLLSHCVCKHDWLGVEMLLADCVCHRENTLLRRVEVTDRTGAAREVRLFLAHDFHIAETDVGDTAFYQPYLGAMVHYKRDNYFLISGQSGGDGMFQYTAGIKGFGGAEGTWRDAEDGVLSGNAVEQGSVDSTVSFRTEVPPFGTATISTWLCAGRSLEEVEGLHAAIHRAGFEMLQKSTADYWRAWTHSDLEDDRLAALPASVAALCRRSLLTIRTQIDNRGAILAANDSDIMATARANYSYMWPRDGAIVSAALDRMGYQDLTRRFFLFCADLLPADRPALMHKYSSDGSWGSTWHPWTVAGKPEIPFQQDSTALVLWALWRHYSRYRDIDFVEPLFHRLVAPAADFMVAYRDAEGMPLPSYDLWEERRGIHAYTCGTVCGALDAAADFAALFNSDREPAYRSAASELRAAIDAHLWDADAGRYARRLIPVEHGGYERDLTIDSALYGLFAFGALPAGSARVEQTLRQTLSRLWVQTDVGGIARYESDYYFRRSGDVERVPGNPWIICTLWAAQYYIARAVEVRELDTALGLLLWTVARAAPTGILAEQVDPFSGAPLSVSPLTWSHAEFVSTALLYLDRLRELGGPAR